MLTVNQVLPQVLYHSSFTSGRGADQGEMAHPLEHQVASQHIYDPRGGRGAPVGDEEGLEIKRDVAGASLGQLMDALSAAIVRDTYINGDRVLMALAEAAVLERELSTKVPRRWRVQQALDALLKMGPHVTVALAAVLEHPAARSHIARIFSD